MPPLTHYSYPHEHVGSRETQARLRASMMQKVSRGDAGDITGPDRHEPVDSVVPMRDAPFRGRVGRTCQRDQCMTKRVLVSEAYYASVDRIRSVTSQYGAVPGNARVNAEARGIPEGGDILRGSTAPRRGYPQQAVCVVLFLAAE